MKLAHQVRSLLTVARPLARRQWIQRHGFRCKGLTCEPFLAVVCKALEPESEPIMEAIIISSDDDNDKRYRGFFQWMRLLLDGHAALPAKIPHAVMIAWQDGRKKDSARPVPNWRCDECYMVLPNATPEGGMYWSACPVCGSDRLFHSDLSRPLGEKWIDPKGK